MTDDVTRGQFAWSSEVEKLRAELAASNARAAVAAQHHVRANAAESKVTVLQARLDALRVAVIELATKHNISSDDLYGTLSVAD